MRLVVLGLSLSSSWGNGHATTYRALLKAFAARGHEVVFLECDRPWYAAHRDLPDPDFCELRLYDGLVDLARDHAGLVRSADAVVVGSYVPDGVAVGTWACDTARGVRAFYDIDTPVTLAKLARGDFEYLDPDLIRRFDLYFSFTGGPTLDWLEGGHGARMARALYCAVDPEAYRPLDLEPSIDLGYLGTYSPDRQTKVEALLLEPARRLPGRGFAVAGPQYPDGIDWPANVRRIDHLPPSEHAPFYAAQRFTLNVTRADMVRAGWSPSVRLFEAMATGVPVVSDDWPGLAELFPPGEAILIAGGTDDVVRVLTETGEAERRRIATNARRLVLERHTAAVRAGELETYLKEAA
ncbi:MAG: glycosyltransferase [Geminicoccaceae bacterium]|nr:glycosyltransferase [Geminicoccaceae bacterium]